MNWFKRKNRKSGNPEIRDRDIRVSGDREMDRITGTAQLGRPLNEGGRVCGGRYTASQGRRLRWPSCQLKPQSFFTSSTLMAMGVTAFQIEEPEDEQEGKAEKEHHCHNQSPHSFGWIRMLIMTNTRNPIPRTMRKFWGKSLKNWLTKPTVKIAFARSLRNFAINSLMRSAFTYQTISCNSLRCQGAFGGTVGTVLFLKERLSHELV